MTDVLLVVVALGLVALPVAVGARVLRRLQARRLDRVEDLEARGSVHTLDLPLLVGAILGFLGTALLGVGLVPLAVWLADGDAEAARAAVAAVTVFAVATTAAVLVGRRSWRFWVVEEEALVRVGPRGERRLPFSEIARVAVVRRLLPTTVVEGRDGTRLRIPDQVDRSDLLLDLVLARTPDDVWAGDAATAPAPSASATPEAPVASTATGAHGVPTHWAVPRWRLVGPWVFLGVLLVFLVAWPWGLVEADDVVRDSLAFVAVGLVLWAGIAFLVVTTNFPAGEPLELHVRPDGIHVRRLRSGWTVVGLHEVVAVTVAPTIIYVRGFPGRRQPVVLLLTDRREITIGDDRQRHLDTTAQPLARALRSAIATARAAHGTAPGVGPDPHLPPPDPVAIALARAADAVDAGHWAAAADELERAIAAAAGTADDRLVETADLWRRAELHERAALLLHAHLDRHPDDATAWERLAAAQRARGREDLAQEATATAERLLLG